MAEDSIDMKELTDNGLADASGLISRREYNFSIVRSRQTAEAIVKKYASEKNIAYTSFAETIENLFENGIINRTSRDAFHNIRIYGNKAVREGDNDPEDAQKAFYLLKNEVRTFMSRKTVSVDRTPVRIDIVRNPSKQAEQELVNNILSETARKRRRPSVESAEDNDDEVKVNIPGIRISADGQVTLASDEPEESSRPDSDRRSRTSKRGSRDDFDEHDDIDEREVRRERSARTGRNGRGADERTKSSNRSGRKGKESGRKNSGRSGRNSNKRSGGSDEGFSSRFSYYDILLFLIPAIALILIVIIIFNLLPSKKDKASETTTVIESVAEETIPETTMPPTTEPPTTEPPVYEYRIKGDGINVRYADNQNRIYAQLSNGTAIGTVDPIDGSDFVAFTLDGIRVVVKKDFIEPIQ